jgi:hypothetical protein
MRMSVVMLLCLLLGCQDESESLPDSSDAAVALDESFRGCPSASVPLALGLRATGQAGAITATLVAASSIPARRYLNDWTLAFTTAAGAPLSDVVVVQARTFMPVHGHDGIVPPGAASVVAPVQLRIDGLNFNMRGPWEVQLKLGSASAGADYVVFSICVSE